MLLVMLILLMILSDTEGMRGLPPVRQATPTLPFWSKVLFISAITVLLYYTFTIKLSGCFSTGIPFPLMEYDVNPPRTVRFH